MKDFFSSLAFPTDVLRPLTMMTQNGTQPGTEIVGDDELADADTEIIFTAPPAPQRTLRLVTQNVVTACHLGVPLDLRQIAIRARNSEFNPQRFPACIMRIQAPRTTALAFSTGKMIVTGAPDVPSAKRATKKHALLLKKVGFDVRITNYRISNMIGTTDVHVPVALETFAARYPHQTSYEPEIFPGAMFYMTEPACCCTVFCSGRITITGVKSVEDLETAGRKIDELLGDAKVPLTHFADPSPDPFPDSAPPPSSETATA